MRRAGVTLAIAMVASLAAAPSARSAPTPSVTLDLATLPSGPAPAMPYLDVATETIHDGAHAVSLAGLQRYTTSAHLWKVSGGYVLDRFLRNDLSPDQNQLLFVDGNGQGRVLSRQLAQNEGVPLVVSSQYGRVAYIERDDRRKRLVVNDVPSGRRVATRSVSIYVSPLTYRGTVLAHNVLGRSFFWRPGVSEVDYEPAIAKAVAVDVRAAQLAEAQPQTGGRVRAYPPSTDEGWIEPTESDLLSGGQPPVVWSTDHARLAGASYEFGGQDHEWNDVHVRRASDGQPVLDVSGGDADHDGMVDQVWWEDPDTLLLKVTTHHFADSTIVRCTVSGSCERLGGISGGPDVVPVTRNVS